MPELSWIEFSDVSLGYGNRIILEGLNFPCRTGVSTGIVGPNGSGKTTILKAILGLLKPISGRISGNGGLHKKVGYVPQRGSLDELFPFSVREIIEMGLYGRLPAWRGPDAGMRGAISGAILQTGLATIAEEPFRSLSGGLKQRVLIARAIVSSPSVLILDEPTYGLDLAQSTLILNLLGEFRRQREISLVIVSHQLSDILSQCQDVLLLHQGGLAFKGPVTNLTDGLLTSIYGMPVRIPRV